MERACCVILAAGDGKRMKSARPKVMCEVLFKPMIQWVTDACQAAGIQNGCVVTGDSPEEIRACLPVSYATTAQQERRGTGHAASMAASYIREGGYEQILVAYGDMPFLRPSDLSASLEVHKSGNNSVTLFAAELDNPYGYGRLITEGGSVSRIVEEKDADDKTKEIRLVNAGIYWFDADFLLTFFENMRNDNLQEEFYLTDAVGFAVQSGGSVGVFYVPQMVSLGANDRTALAELNRKARETVLVQHMENGVNIPFADGVVIGSDVRIGKDTTILPGTIIKGASIIGEGCEIGPNSNLSNAIIGDECKIISSQIENSRVANRTKIGPMSNIRPNCDIGPRVKIGDFVEVKNSIVGENTSIAHLTYVGDTDLGAGCNLGCGVVTVNYDGQSKYRTVIGDGVFLGCNCNLIAPVTIGDRVYAAAGTTITKDIPPDALVIGRARETIKENWAKKHGLHTKKKD